MKSSKKTYYIVSGNINGNEQEPILAKSPKEADIGIAGTVLGALGKMGYVKPDGELKDSICVELYGTSDTGSYHSSPWTASDFDEIAVQEDASRHVSMIALRHRRSCRTFAEWKVTKISR